MQKWTGPCGFNLTCIINYRMADSLGSRPGSSDEYHDTFCEPCEESRGRNVKIECFCKNCNQYLCIEYYTTHGSLKATRGHVIQTGDDMPKSMADKPPRYDACDDHPKHLKDQFCCDHGTLVCSTCCSTSHSKCNTKSVADTCQYTQQSEVDTLRDVNKTYKSQLFKFLSSVDKHGEKLTEQKKTMMKEAQTTYDKMLAEINKSFQNVKAVIEAECGSQVEAISQAKQEINAQMTRADTEINFTDKLRGKPITVKSFLSLQESVSNTRESVAAIESLKDSLSLMSLSFEPSKDVQKLVSQTFSFGALNKQGINVGFDVTLPDIKFPISLKTSAAGTVGSTQQQGHTGPGAPQVVGTVGSTQQQGYTGPGAPQVAGTVGSTQQQGHTGPGAQQVVSTVGTIQQQGYTGLGAPSAVGTVGTIQQQGYTGPGAPSAVGTVGTIQQQGYTGLGAPSAVGTVGTIQQQGYTGLGAPSAVGTVGSTQQQGHTRPGAPSAVGTVGTIQQQGYTGLGAPSAVGTVGSIQQQGHTRPGAPSAVGTVGSTQQQGHTGLGAPSAVGTVGSTQQQWHTRPGAPSAVGTVGTIQQQGYTGLGAPSAVGTVGTLQQYRGIRD